MNLILLHEHNEFPDLIRIVADKQLIDPVIVEKDYWMMHVLWGLQQQGFQFSLKGGTSLIFTLVAWSEHVKFFPRKIFPTCHLDRKFQFPFRKFALSV
jgi:hypothetical protein